MSSFELLAETASWMAIAPELFLLAAVVVILSYDVTAKPIKSDVHAVVVVLGVGLAAVATAVQYRMLRDGTAIAGERFFIDMLEMDGLAVLARAALLVVLALALALGWRFITEMEARRAETIALMLLAVIGFSLLAASANLMMLFIGLEVGSISLYVLAGMTRDQPWADEAALKYFLLGSFASAVFVYGVALFYAATGGVGINDYDVNFAGVVNLAPGVSLLALALMVAGLLFKVTAAPFHSWAPDVYQGAPAGAVGFMAAAAKIGGFAGLARIVYVAFGSQFEAWQPPLAGVAAASIVVGTLLAISQSDVRRMLAYSGVAHAGFILVGIAAGAVARQEVMFYLAVYVVQLVAAFGVVAVVSGASSSGSPRESYVGLGRTSPFLAARLGLMMIGMSGMPLTSGFVAKFGVFRQVWTEGLEWLVVVGLVASVAAFFFYLRVVVDMFMRDPVAEGPGAARSVPALETPARWALVLAAFVTIAAGVYPGPLLDFISNVL